MLCRTLTSDCLPGCLDWIGLSSRRWMHECIACGECLCLWFLIIYRLDDHEMQIIGIRLDQMETGDCHTRIRSTKWLNGEYYFMFHSDTWNGRLPIWDHDLLLIKFEIVWNAMAMTDTWIENANAHTCYLKIFACDYVNETKKKLSSNCDVFVDANLIIESFNERIRRGNFVSNKVTNNLLATQSFVSSEKKFLIVVWSRKTINCSIVIASISSVEAYLLIISFDFISPRPLFYRSNFIFS